MGFGWFFLSEVLRKFESQLLLAPTEVILKQAMS